MVSKKHVPLNVSLVAKPFKLDNAIHDPKPPQVFGICNLVLKVRRVQFLVAIKY